MSENASDSEDILPTEIDTPSTIEGTDEQKRTAASPVIEDTVEDTVPECCIDETAVESRIHETVGILPGTPTALLSPEVEHKKTQPQSQYHYCPIRKSCE